MWHSIEMRTHSSPTELALAGCMYTCCALTANQQSFSDTMHFAAMFAAKYGAASFYTSLPWRAGFSPRANVLHTAAATFSRVLAARDKRTIAHFSNTNS